MVSIIEIRHVKRRRAFGTRGALVALLRTLQTKTSDDRCFITGHTTGGKTYYDREDDRTVKQFSLLQWHI